MAGLTPRRQRGLAALLTANSLAGAAEQAKIGERTLRRWLSDPTFRQAYRQASRRLLDEATGQLRAAAGEAVRTLRTALQAENDHVKVRAAVALLELAVKVEVDELAERVAALEAAAATPAR